MCFSEVNSSVCVWSPKSSVSTPTLPHQNCKQTHHITTHLLSGNDQLLIYLGSCASLHPPVLNYTLQSIPVYSAFFFIFLQVLGCFTHSYQFFCTTVSCCCYLHQCPNHTSKTHDRPTAIIPTSLVHNLDVAHNPLYIFRHMQDKFNLPVVSTFIHSFILYTFILQSVGNHLSLGLLPHSPGPPQAPLPHVTLTTVSHKDSLQINNQLPSSLPSNPLYIVSHDYITYFTDLYLSVYCSLTSSLMPCCDTVMCLSFHSRNISQATGTLGMSGCKQRSPHHTKYSFLSDIYNIDIHLGIYRYISCLIRRYI